MFKEYWTPVWLPTDLNIESLLSNLFKEDSNGLVLSTENVLHLSKSGKVDLHVVGFFIFPATLCFTAVEPPLTKGNKILVPNSFVSAWPVLLANWKGICIPGIFAAVLRTGLNTASVALAPIFKAYVPGLYKPYLAAKGNAPPAKANPIPNIAPSAPNLNLLINLAAAKSLPVLPSSLTLLTK